MSIEAQTAAAIGRGFLVSALVIPAAGPLSRWLAARTGQSRVVAWVLLLAPFFTPSLLISYAFAKFALALVVTPWSHQALYIGVLALKVMPVAVILRLHLRSPLSPAAWRIYRTLHPAPWWERLLFRIRGAGEGPWVAGGLVFILVFADFELASLWSIRTWTVAIFDAQIGGLPLRETLRLAAPPCLVALALLAWVSLRSRHVLSAPPAASQTSSRWPWLYLALSSCVVTILPLAIVTAQAVSGWRQLARNFVLAPEIGASLAIAAVAALLADIGFRLSRLNRTAMIISAAPGLAGTLTVSLLILALFQIPILHFAYNSPLPLILALAIVLMPLGVLLSALQPASSPALHIARQTGSRRLLWTLQTRPHLIACALLFCWAYFDFTAASILAPVSLTPVFVRLHNLAHYGQTAVLSGMMLAAFAAPWIVLLLTGTALHLYARRDGR